MKTQYNVALGLVLVSWVATGALWLRQKNDIRVAEQSVHQSMRSMQDGNQSQWGGMRQRYIPVPDAKKKIITATIIQQLDAFKQDDYTRAAEFQSSNLRRTFSSTAMFRAIIRRSYPEFADYTAVTFGRARMDPDQKRIAILTLVKGRTGKTSRVIYFMVNEDNEYRVDGVARARDRGRFQAPSPPSRVPKAGAPGLPPGISPQQPPPGAIQPGVPPRRAPEFAPPGGAPLPAPAPGNPNPQTPDAIPAPEVQVA